jgi:disulfide bond formation protein DsbB
VAPAQKLAQRLAIGVPALLLAGAYLSEYGFGLFPCEMCWWQRWPHFAAVALGLVSTLAPPRNVWVGLAAVAILLSGAIGMFHAGVEYDWWEGITGCATLDMAGADPLEAVLNAPIVRCDQAPWNFLGLSLAGWNAVISIASALFIFVLLARSARPAPSQGLAA